MHLDLTDEETFARLNLLTVTIEADRYPVADRSRQPVAPGTGGVRVTSSPFWIKDRLRLG